ncbi:unnamed protein product [Camellia sinensis]
MESLQGPINPCLFGEEHVDVETTNKTLGFSCFGQFVSADHHSLSFQEEEEEETQLRLRRSGSLEDKMPFLEMLQSVESPSYSPLCELSLQALLNLQQQQQSKNNPWDQSHSFQAPEQPESCLTSYHDVLVKSETNNQQQQVKPPVEEMEMEMEMAETRTGRDERGLKTVVKREKRKRMKPAAKNKEEAESQRMTHIAVERNRRRQMNDHLTSLRSLMPSSYIQRGDQASIIGGAIDFLKELEQLLQSLQAQKRMKKSELSSDQGRGGEEGGGGDTASSSTSSSSTTATENCTEVGITTTARSKGRSNEFTAEKKSAAADVRVTVIQKHVNLKVECPRIPGQLLKAIVAFEGLKLTVLHLNITSFETSIHYSFNLKISISSTNSFCFLGGTTVNHFDLEERKAAIEDDCEVGSADGIAVAVHQIFSFVNNDDI